jgi:hypothetical protein
MNKRVLRLLMAILWSSSTLAQTAPDSASICNAALAKDVTTSIKTQEQDLDFISVVDKRTFEQSKTSNSFGASVPLADDLLRISDDWTQFQEKRTSYFHAINYRAHYEEGDYQHFEITSPLAYPAWTQCIETLTASNSASGGLYTWKAEDKQDSVLVNIYYKVPEIAKKKYKYVSLTGETKVGTSPTVSRTPQRIQTEQLTNIIIDRPNSSGVPQTVEATFRAGTFASHIYSEWVLPPAPTTTQVITEHLSQDFPVSLFHHHFREQQGHLSLLGTDLTVDGTITSVVYKGCDGGGCGYVWYSPGGQNIRSPDGRTETTSIATDYSGPADLMLHYTVFYDHQTSVCIGRDGQRGGTGCPVRTPSDVLNPANKGPLQPLQ